ncbi:hypothetical protein NXT3_PB00348 (plasmid) [Sinorhizobium fredii]|uniref:Uncharacterized protein n=1 Tax=Rhizobium fredii TaxID=380 RepID=A0A2L0HBZ2_RHIFR|nr:hypothetical protein NXT3_PB00348 [Sinorhizobium fredii]
MSSVALGAAAVRIVTRAAEGEGADEATGCGKIKASHIATRTVGCFEWPFRSIAHIVRANHDVQASKFLLSFNEDQTSRRIC